MKRMKKAAAWLLLLALLVTCVPVTGLTVKAETTVEVTVIVENSTYEGSGYIKGVWVNRTIQVPEGTSMMDCATQAMDLENVTYVKEESWGSMILAEINGLRQQGGSWAGWQAALNDWFISSSMTGYTMKNHDVIHLYYSCDGGMDVGNDYSNSSTSLDSITFSGGRLDTAFDAADTEYVLYLPQGVDEISCDAAATNKAFQVRLYQNTYLSDAAYRQKNVPFSITSGDTLYIGVGDSSWDNSYWNPYTGTTYTIHVLREGEGLISQPVADQTIADIAGDVVAAYQAAENIEYGYEWELMILAGLEQLSSTSKQAYFNSVAAQLKSIGSNKFSATYSTTNAKVVLTLSAMGYDPTKVAGYDLVAPLTDTEWVMKQGINGECYALLALDSCQYGNSSVRQIYIDDIISKQLANGAFTWGFGGNGDTDLTAYVVQALTPYYQKSRSASDVNASIDKAIQYLSSSQASNGHYVGIWDTSSESIAQVIIALTGMGINPKTDARFIKNGVSLLDALYQYYLGEGTFAHASGEGSNVMATQQCGLAVTAYQRLIAGKPGVYQTEEIAKIDGNPVEPQEPQEPEQPQQPQEPQQSQEPTQPQQPIDTSLAVPVNQGDGSGITPTVISKKTTANTASNATSQTSAKETMVSTLDEDTGSMANTTETASDDSSLTTEVATDKTTNALPVAVLLVCIVVAACGVTFLVVTGKKKNAK